MIIHQIQNKWNKNQVNILNKSGKYENTEKITLFGEEYKIERLNKHELICPKCDAKELGDINFNKKKIRLAIDDLEHEELELLLHELGHYFGQYVDGGGSEAFANIFAKYVESIIKQLNYKWEIKKE